MKYTKHTSSGFTLIELLVVIAIIGILASVILASLNTSRARAVDAKIKSQLGSMRAQAQLYTGVGFAVSRRDCLNPPIPGNTLFSEGSNTNSLRDLIATLPTSAAPGCASGQGLPSNGASWAVAAVLSNNGVWCVDSTGAARDTFAFGVSAGDKYTGVATAAIDPGTRSCL